MTRVVFIILNYKTYQDTIRVTNELLETKRDDFRILIVDNASPNESFVKLYDTFATNPLVEVIASPENGGYANGNNYGLRYMKKYAPEFACIINNDVHFSWDTIDSLAKKYRELDSPAVISPLQMLPGNKVANFPTLLKVPDFLYDLRCYSLLFGLPQHKFVQNTKYDNVQKVSIVPGAFLFVEYNMFERLGFFNEVTFLFCEERFLSKSVYDAGLNNYIILDKTYLHEHSKTISSEASKKRQRELMNEGRKNFIKQYRKLPLLQIGALNIQRCIYEAEVYLLNLIRRKKI